MKFLYLDCFAGVSGDMFLSALIDLGIPLEQLQTSLAGLGLQDYRLTAEKTCKNRISGTKITVHLFQTDPPHRHLPDILQIINDSSLPAPIKEKSSAVFKNLAAAEAKVHHLSVDRVSFHEVGAVDAIIDIVGTVTALDILKVEQVFCSPLPLGSGLVECAHGILPLPAPATLELLQGVPLIACNIRGETVTPTGAALVKTLASGFGPFPSMQVQAIGYGAGAADRNIPNLVRAVLAEALPNGSETSGSGEFAEDMINQVEANVDDMNPEFYDYIVPLLFSAGALDVFLTPVIMKKGRPAQVVTCLVPDHKTGEVITVLLTETTTLGVRSSPCHRFKLVRETTLTETPYGLVKVKLGRHPGSGRILNIAPEWEDCKLLAAKNKISVKIIYDLAKAAVYKEIQGCPND